jgi:hypothetical protein
VPAARKQCPGAIVKFPEQDPISISSPITLFNGPKVRGFDTEATIPPIAGGAGVPISGFLRVGRRWTHKGKCYSYVNARCETGHLQARGELTFKDGTFLSGTLVRGCQVRD